MHLLQLLEIVRESTMITCNDMICKYDEGSIDTDGTFMSFTVNPGIEEFSLHVVNSELEQAVVRYNSVSVDTDYGVFVFRFYVDTELYYN